MFTRKNVSIAATLSALGLFSVGALAHLGVNGQFDVSKTLTKKGTVTKVRFAYCPADY